MTTTEGQGMAYDTELGYIPDYATPPGDSLRETLDELGLSQAEFARRAGLSTKHVHQLLKGEVSLTEETAHLIERVTGVPGRIWLRLESNYRSRLVALAEREVLHGAADWVRSLPVSDLVERGWIAGSTDAPSLAQELLSFFGVASVDIWKSIWRERLQVEWLRTGGRGQTDETALATWLRTGELLAQRAEVEPFDEAKFRASFVEIRRATRSPRTAVGKVQEICASSGVVLVVTDAFKGSRVSGAARWLGPGRPLIHLSRRYKRDDSFWFSFFHEAGHVLLHPKKKVYVDDLFEQDQSDIEFPEREANAFAVRSLLPDVTVKDLRGVATLSDALRLAERVEVAPSVLVGQLHYQELKPPSWGRQLIREVILPDEPS